MPVFFGMKKYFKKLTQNPCNMYIPMLYYNQGKGKRKAEAERRNNDKEPRKKNRRT